MRGWRVLGWVAVIATAGALAAAPAVAAASVQVPLGSTFNAMVMLKPGSGAPQTASNSACRATPGATFGKHHGLNASTFPSGSFTPAGSPVPFVLGPLGAKNAVCIRDSGTATGAEPTSITITVPAGKYTDAYFLAAVANGPSLVTITPVYSSGAGTPVTALFDDWCAPALSGGALTTDSAAAFPNPGNRVGNVHGATTNSGETNLPCTLWNTHVSGLNGSETLIAMKLTQAASGTAVPPGTGVPANATEQSQAVLNIAALTLEGTASSATSLPKTGGNQTGLILGSVLLAAGLGLALRRRESRAR